MNNEFCTYKQAQALKELGFDEPCIGWATKEYMDIIHTSNRFKIYDENELPTKPFGVPLKQQVFRWFREKHNLRGFIGFRPNVKMFDYHIYDMSLSGKEYVKQRTMEEYNKDPLVGMYEEAESACIDKLIEIVKQKS